MYTRFEFATDIARHMMEEKSMSHITKRVPVIVEADEEIGANGNLPPVLRVVGGIP